MCRSNNRNRCFLGPAGADAAGGEAATTVGTASKTAVTNKTTTAVTTMAPTSAVPTTIDLTDISPDPEAGEGAEGGPSTTTKKRRREKETPKVPRVLRSNRTKVDYAE